MSRAPRSAQASLGFTLLEMMVAAIMLAMIMIITEQTISQSSRSSDVVAKRSQELNDIERLWILLENDLRNAVPVAKQIPFSEPLPAMKIDKNERYVMSLIRIGQANPMQLPRSEVLRVAYRLEENGELWRDSWIDPYNPQEELARPQRVMGDVEEFSVEALPNPPQGRSLDDGPWLEIWPNSTRADDLPLALNIKVILKNETELRRFVTLIAQSAQSQGGQQP